MITNDQWITIEQNLYGSFGSVSLQCDEFKVTIRKVQLSDIELGYMVYVNGEFKGEWLTNETIYCTKFFCRSDKPLISKATLDLIKQFRSKQEYEEAKAKTLATYTPFFKSLKRLRQTLETNCKSIKFIN